LWPSQDATTASSLAHVVEIVTTTKSPHKRRN
jgi:hypothetical protein